MTSLKMGLLENAYDSLNESLRATIRASDNPRAWKFAVLHIVQTLELLLKERLYREHSLLIYENVDSRKRTVSLELALTRISGPLAIELTNRDRAAIEKAQKWRNLIVHYEFEFSLREVELGYVQLFEWVTSFHAEHLGGELHDHIDEELREREAELMEFFRSEMVLYNGVPVAREWPLEIVEAQRYPALRLQGDDYARIPYGSEPGVEIPLDPSRRCHDCAVVPSQYHALGCDWETCPRCLQQLLSCECWGDDLEPALLTELPRKDDAEAEPID